MTDAQFAYSLPLFIAEVWCFGISASNSTSASNSIAKYLEINGRVEKFLSDISNKRFAILTHIY